MKHFAITCFSILILGFSANSQSMDPGTGFLSLGIGPSNTYVSYRTSAAPAFRVSYDKGIKQIGPGTLTLGGMFGGFNRSYHSTYFDHKYVKNYDYRYSWTYIIAALRLGYYYNFAELDVKEFNIYGGLSVGPRLSLFFETYDGPEDGSHPVYNNSPFGFHFGAFLGANYFITPKTAIYTEFGYDISWFTLGVTFNM